VRETDFVSISPGALPSLEINCGTAIKKAYLSLDPFCRAMISQSTIGFNPIAHVGLPVYICVIRIVVFVGV
jgi:hypothetical protein